MYRIPTLIKTHNNTLLAFCEGRRSLADHGDIDIVMKSSTDNGKTWSALKLIWSDAKNTCGNACPVIDEVSGDLILITTWNNLKVFTTRSADNGNTWSQPVDITGMVKPSEWHWYATGPVHAIQLEYAFKGRIVVPCNHTLTGTPTHYSNIIFSDDHGLTWQNGHFWQLLAKNGQKGANLGKWPTMASNGQPWPKNGQRWPKRAMWQSSLGAMCSFW